MQSFWSISENPVLQLQLLETLREASSTQEVQVKAEPLQVLHGH
jgi:hypothetical protein